MALCTVYFDGSVAAPTDPNAVWSNLVGATDGDIASAAFTSLTGSTTSNYLTAQGTSTPVTGIQINSVQCRSRTSPGNVTTNNTTVIYTAALAETLGTVTRSGNTIAYSNYVTLTPPAAGWNYTNLKNLVFKCYTTNNDVTLYQLELLIDFSHSYTGNVGSYLTAGNGISTSGNMN